MPWSPRKANVPICTFFLRSIKKIHMEDHQCPDVAAQTYRYLVLWTFTSNHWPKNCPLTFKIRLTSSTSFMTWTNNSHPQQECRFALLLSYLFIPALFIKKDLRHVKLHWTNGKKKVKSHHQQKISFASLNWSSPWIFYSLMVPSITDVWALLWEHQLLSSMQCYSWTM